MGKMEKRLVTSFSSFPATFSIQSENCISFVLEIIVRKPSAYASNMEKAKICLNCGKVKKQIIIEILNICIYNSLCSLM